MSVLCNILGTTLHVFRDYPSAMQIWTKMMSDNIINNFIHVDLKNWIYLNLNYKGSDEIKWINYCAMMYHCFWLWRNRELHNKTFSDTR